MSAFTKWDSVINGVSNEELGTNFILNVIIDIDELERSVLGRAELFSVYNASNSYINDTTILSGLVYGKTLFPYSGKFIINSSILYNISTELKYPSEKSTLYYVTLHEIGHLLGIGNLWQYSIVNPPINKYTEDSGRIGTYYIGTNALREYRNVFNDISLIGIPIENNGGIGTAIAHFEEGVETNEEGQYIVKHNRYINGKLYPGLDQELMTGFSENFKFDMPLSRMTIGLLEDLGYSVNYSEADPYNNPKTPWTNDLSYTFVENSNANLITLEGNCFIDISLIYLIGGIDYNISGELIDDSGRDVSDFTGVIPSNKLYYTPTTGEINTTFSFSYYISYYDSQLSEYIYSHQSKVTIAVLP